MVKYRPHKAGFIVLYVLTALCLSDAVYSMIATIYGLGNEYMQSFSWFSYLVAVLAILYVRLYASTRVEIDDKSMHIVFPVYIQPEPGAKRAMFLYRQGSTDLKLVNKRFPLAELERYGYIEDLGYKQLDRSGVKENNKFFPVHEIALVMKDGKRYHMNGGFYSVKQLQGMVEKIHVVTGLAPEGKLASLVPGIKANEGQQA